MHDQVDVLELPETIKSEKSSPEKERARALNGSPAEREAFTVKVVVHTPHLKLIDDCVQSLMEVACRIPFPGGFCVTGEGGTGKTVLLEHIKRRYPSEEGYFAAKRTVVELRLPERPTGNGIAQLLLNEMGNELVARGKAPVDIYQTLYKTLNACGTKLLLIDEAQHLLPTYKPRSNAARLTGAAGDFLKLLHDKTSIPIGFFGPPEIAGTFDRDAQLRSRFPGRIRLNEYAGDAAWNQVLAALDKALPLSESSHLSYPEISKWLHKSSQGNFRELKRILGRAVFLASRDRKNTLTLVSLEKAARLINMHGSTVS